MIKNDEELAQAVEQLGRMYRALAALRKDVLPQSPAQFALLAEGPEDEILKLNASIDAYTGLMVIEHHGLEPASDQQASEQLETHAGELREIDLDNRSFILRNAGDVREIRCNFEDDLLETAKGALDRRVQVRGIRRIERGRRVASSLRVVRLKIVDEATTE